MVIFTLIRLEWGSVQIKLASMILTFERPLNFRRHNASNSLDSGEAVIQCAGGCSHLSQLDKPLVLEDIPIDEESEMTLTPDRCVRLPLFVCLGKYQR